jgi:hypothetical protein
MNLKRTLVLSVGGGAVVIWIAAAATSMSRPSTEPVTQPAARAIDTSGAALAAEIARLHERLRPTAVPLQTRDLFSYGEHRASTARAETAHASVAAVEVPTIPAAVPLKLIGIAEDGPADAIVRTAVLSGLGDLFLVKQGDTAASRFRVIAISQTGVELVDSADQSTIRLSLP